MFSEVVEVELIVGLGDVARVGSATTIVDVPMVNVCILIREYDTVELGSTVTVLNTV